MWPWLKSFFAPPPDPLIAQFDRVERSFETMRTENEFLRDAMLRRDETRDERKAEMHEALAMAGAGPWTAPDPGSPLRESAATVGMKESIAQLELTLEDVGWRRMLGGSEYEFTRWGIQQIILLCRLFRIKNPLIQRGILVSAYYVFGRGFQVVSQDETANEELAKFFDDPRNRAAIGKQALIEHESTLYTDGNIFWALFARVDDGRCVVRTIDAIEIQEIITDPNDSAVPWFYRRQWVQKAFDQARGVTRTEMMEGWYVDINHDAEGVKEINGKPIMLDTAGQPVRIYHRKDGGLPKWLFGCPRAYAAIDWARAYKNRLEDYATIVRQLSRFAFDVQTKGGAPAIAALKNTLATTLGNSGTSLESNPSPTVGSSFISGPGNTLKAVDAAGKTPSPEEGRRLAHMVYMVFGLPETFFSDVSVGTLATATSLDRPTELKFLTHQEMWKEDLAIIARFVLSASASAPKGRMREAKKKVETIDVQVVFPPILEGDIPAEIASVVQAMTLGSGAVIGIDERAGVRELLNLVGVDDPETVLAAMYPDGSYDPDASLRLAAPSPSPTAVKQAVTELRKTIEKFKS